MNICLNGRMHFQKENWKDAIDGLHVTNNFPEFTGRICPAPCENACTLNIRKEPVTIRENEAAVAEKGFELGFIKPQPPYSDWQKNCCDWFRSCGFSVCRFA